MLNRKEIALLISEKLTSEKESLQNLYNKSVDNIGYFYIDDLY